MEMTYPERSWQPKTELQTLRSNCVHCPDSRACPCFVGDVCRHSDQDIICLVEDEIV